jgi:hypothetical protein
MIDLIYCAGGNPLLSQIAFEEGWQLGVRSDKSHVGGLKVNFVDIRYKKPNFEKHLRRVAKERPKYAIVPDLSDKEVHEADIEQAIFRAFKLADYCEIPLIVPKLPGQVLTIPKEIAIAYSIPTRYGGAQYPVWELVGRRVHLLGGNPHSQLKYYRHIQGMAQVISADGNMAQKLAVEKLKFWQCGGRVGGQWVEWPLRGKENQDQYPHCWRQSCKNIYAMWQKELK